MQMATARCLLLVAVLGLTWALDVEYIRRLYMKSSTISLKLLEIRKVMNDSSPLARDYNVKVVLADHEPMKNLGNWTLGLADDKTEKNFLSLPNNGSQTEIVFDAELTDSQYVFVVARNLSDITVGIGYEAVDIKDKKSRLAWVGDEYRSSGSSLRVHTGDLKEVQVGSMVCRQEDSPCYFLDATLPQEIPRCYNAFTGDKSPVQVCDDTISRFQKTPEIAQLERSGDNLTVQVAFSRTPNRVEVVVFDPSDPARILSPADYRCQAVGDPWQVGHCTQQMVGTKDLLRLGVLVVALDDQGYVFESSLTTYGGTTVQANVGVIVGSVLGALLGILLIVGLAVYLVKKNKKQNKKITSPAEPKYTAAPTQEPSQEEEA